MKVTTMKKKIRIIGIGVITVIVLTFSWYLIDRFSYSKELSYYSVTVKNDTTLTIGIIGDSWVAGGKLDSLLYNGLLEKGFKTQILSSGHPGAKSKLIYQNLFEEKANEHSSKFIIENRPDYCIVIAGVNDAAGQVGANFYSHHMLLIINTLLHYKIKPIIVELPEFGIIETTNEMGFIKSERNKIYAKFTNSGEIDNIRTYRKALIQELESKNLKDSIIQIDFDNVCDDYSKCLELYNGTSHLSKKGNEKLSQIIINEMTGKINAR
jgi:hypothetical protein